MTIYKIGNQTIILEEIFSIRDVITQMPNSIHFSVFSKFGGEAVVVIKAFDSERVSLYSRPSSKFLERVEEEIEYFKLAWEQTLSIKKDN